MKNNTEQNKILKDRFERAHKILIRVVDNHDPKTAASIYYKYFNKKLLDKKFECQGIPELLESIDPEKLSLKYVMGVMIGAVYEWQKSVMNESMNSYSLDDLKKEVEDE